MSAQENTEDEAIARATELGRLEAENLDARLRLSEHAEREQLLAELAWRPQSSAPAPETTEDSLKVVQLEARVSELSSYVDAVNSSLPWRMIQWGRRLIGRGW